MARTWKDEKVEHSHEHERPRLTKWKERLRLDAQRELKARQQARGEAA